MLVWCIDETSGFDTAWVAINHERLRAEGWACGQLPTAYWISYSLETTDAYVTSRMAVKARWESGRATLDLRREDGLWKVNGEARPDLDEALDCDLAACPLTNTMPILRYNLHRQPGDQTFVIAFIVVPTLEVVVSRQRYTHIRQTDRGAIIHYRSGSLESELTIDRDGLVVEYPRLGRRIEAQPPGPGIRAAGPGSPRPE